MQKLNRSTLAYMIGGSVLAGAFALTLIPAPHPAPEDISAIVRGISGERGLAQLDYDIHSVRTGEGEVPHVFLASLPAELAQVPVPAVRKDLFLAMVLPLVLRTNQDILAERTRLDEITAKVEAGQNLAAEDKLWLAAMGDRYGTDADDLAELSLRMDIVPPSLALAQAAEESGWGTSRFAQDGNALFGQRAFEDDETAAPDTRDSGGVRIRTYANLMDAVRAYTINLNTHPAYASFRKERAKRRAAGLSLDGYGLAPTLVRYSENGVAYVQSVRRLIRMNRLNDFDNARLGERPAI